ncbi:hypothetical protein LTR53_017720, partial [Teratosphaeriaceae sp. CCFEE 6253]
MAKLSSTARPRSRPGSAAPEGASATAPPRTMRATRSQSREPVEPARAAVHREPPRKRGKQTKALGTVAEEPTVEPDHRSAKQAAQQAALEAAREEPDASEDDAAGTRPLSSHSGISGTTAKTSFSKEELADLDVDVMLDVLPDLLRAAEQMAAFLVPADPDTRPVVWKEIRMHGSRHSKAYGTRLKALELHKDSFGSQGYIQPSIVNRKLLDVQSVAEVYEGPWRPDDLIYKINLAQMLRTVLVLGHDADEMTPDGYNALELLDTHFAAAIAGPEFDTEALRLLLAVQTQLAILRLSWFRDSPDYEPIEIINETFYARDAATGDLVYKDAAAMHLDDLPDPTRRAWYKTIAKLVEQGLQAPFHDGLPLGAAQTQLRRRCPWSQLVERVVAYDAHRRAQLDQHIAGAGGVERIVEGMEREVRRVQDVRSADRKRRSLGTVSGTPRRGFGKGAIAALRAREKRLSEASTAPTAGTEPLAPVAPVAQMVEPRSTAPPRAGRVGAAEHNDWTAPSDDEAVAQPVAQRAASASELTGFQE